MDRFLQRGFDEYLRQKDLKKETFRQSGLVFEIVKKCEARANFSDLSPTAKTRRDVYLFLLMPLVEVAWADGRVTPREMDSILEIAARQSPAFAPVAENNRRNVEFPA
jgi:hypothetical protein